MEDIKISGFITNLHAYNCGELVGEWVDFPINDDELKEVLKRIGITENCEETFFSDFDCNFSIELDEYMPISELNNIANALIESDISIELLNAILEAGFHSSIIDAIEHADDYSLYSDVVDDEDVGYMIVHDWGFYDLRNMGNLEYYINYERLGRDYVINSDCCHTTQGFLMAS